MSIPYIHVTGFYSLWAYFLLCLALKLFLDFRKKHREGEQMEAVERFFRPGAPDVQSPEFQTVRRYCRRTECFSRACDCYAACTADGPDGADYARLSACLLTLFHDQLDSGRLRYPLFRCMLLERMALCQLSSPRLDRFLDASREGSELEQLWCGRCTRTPAAAGGAR